MKHLRFIAAALALVGSPGLARGQSEWTTDEPAYRDIRANAPIPPWQHVMNEGGADGAGLCVVASELANGQYQGVPEFAAGKDSRVWKLAKERDGGYYPSKLDQLFRDAGVETTWFQAEGSAAELLPVIEYYNRQGLPVGVTMSFGERYRTAQNPSGRIHHMVSAVHLDSSLACVVDNNFPGKYIWMTREEFGRRLVDGPAGWIVVLLWFGEAIKVGVLIAAAAGAIVGLGFVLSSGAVFVVGWISTDE